MSTVSKWVFTVWKVSKHGVISGPYFPVFSPNTGKYVPEITLHLGTFHSVTVLWYAFFCLMITKLRQLNGCNCFRHRENMLNRLNSLYSTYSYGKLANVLRMNQVDTWFSRVFPILVLHTAPRVNQHVESTKIKPLNYS